jgi:hypothetical protein
MPKYNNRFQSPTYLEETIQDENGTTVGSIRIKPSSVLWRPTNAQKFYAVSLDEFSTWITDPATGAKRTTS